MKQQHIIKIWEEIFHDPILLIGLKDFNDAHKRSGQKITAIQKTLRSVKISTLGDDKIVITFNLYVPSKERVGWTRSQMKSLAAKSKTCDLMKKLVQVFPNSNQIEHIFERTFGCQMSNRQKNIWDMFVKFIFCHLLSRSALPNEPPSLIRFAMNKALDMASLTDPWTQLRVAEHVFLDCSKDIERVICVDNFEIERLSDHPFISENYSWECIEYLLDAVFQDGERKFSHVDVDGWMSDAHN